jgi:CRP/FNR family transcriptional regulator, nitrogen fixation regulation protein
MLTHSALAKHAFHPLALEHFSIESDKTAGTDAESDSLDDLIHLVGTVSSYPRRTEIIHEDEAGDRLYKVVSGTVCTYKILSDGRRQIGSFYLPGDVFGLEFTERHNLAAETITNVRILMIKKRALAVLAKQSAAMTNQLLQLATRELARAQDRVLLLSSKSAQERVVGFLFEMLQRSSPSENTVELQMSRQDMADYLGLTIETVSRTLWALENSGVIQISSRRRIVFRDRSALARLQQ